MPFFLEMYDFRAIVICTGTIFFTGGLIGTAFQYAFFEELDTYLLYTAGAGLVLLTLAYTF